MAVKVLENLVGLSATISSVGRLLVDEGAEERDAAVLFAGLVASVALGADQLRVGAVGLEMGFEARPCNFCLFAGSASYLLLSARFPMGSLLGHFKWRRPALVRALDNSVLALAEKVLLQVSVCDRTRFASIVETAEARPIKEGLLDGVHFAYLVQGLFTVLAG